LYSFASARMRAPEPGVASSMAMTSAFDNIGGCPGDCVHSAWSLRRTIASRLAARRRAPDGVKPCS
jgi:hypothetical protein